MVWSGDAMVLRKLPVLGRPTTSDQSRARAYCAEFAVGSGGVVWIFSVVCHFSLLSPSPEDGPILTKILSLRAVKPKTTDHVKSTYPIFLCDGILTKVF